jgi:chromosome segregation ATPase
MTEEFERELSRSLERLRDAITPYTRFVRAEREKLTAIEGELESIRSALGQIQSRIEEM